MIETRRIRKDYPGTVALDDISLRFEAGKVSALLGKNGAGKSTLVKILAGTVQPTAGEILIDGKPIKLQSAASAFRQGIATVHQELSLIPALTVAENILLGRLPKRGPIIDWPAARARARSVLAKVGLDLDVTARVSQLGVAQQQLVEIAKAMSFEPAVLMLDEPTSALARDETDSLFRTIRRLAGAGVAIIYITHRLHELDQIADSITVLRDGKFIGTVQRADASHEQIVKMIFGEVVQRKRPAAIAADATPLLEVKGLSQARRFHDITFTLRRGEILGIAGMLGSGRTSLVRALFGVEPFDEGQLILNGHTVTRPSIRGMKKLGMALIPEHRKEQSLFLSLSTRMNMCLASLSTVGKHGVITRRAEREVAAGYVDRLAIKLSDTDQPIGALSGGNQQKVVIGKWLNTMPSVMLFDEPTRGVDLQAKQHIFQTMWNLSTEGIGSLFISSELEELVEVCHRILIMKAGHIVDEVFPNATSVDELVVRCMTQSADSATVVTS